MAATAILPEIGQSTTPAKPTLKQKHVHVNLDDYFREDSAYNNDFLLLFDKASTEGKVWYLIMDDASRRPKPLPKTNFIVMSKLKDIYGYKVVTLDNKMYILGGRHVRSGSYLGHVFKYDPKTHSWSRKTSMNRGRCRFSAVVMDGCIYVCGGEGRGGRLMDSVECYDCKADIWVNMHPMPRPRADHASCVTDKKIFVSGGKGRQGSSHAKNNGTNVFWHYDPFSDRWAIAVGTSLLPWTLESHNMVSHRGKIYCFGGVAYKKFDDDLRYTESENRDIITFSIERGTLDLRINGIWDALYPKMLTPRANAGAAMLGHNIYVIGGRNVTSGRPQRVVEYFNTRKNKWYHAFDLPKEMGNYINMDIVPLRVPTENKEFSALGRALQDKWVLW